MTNNASKTKLTPCHAIDTGMPLTASQAVLAATQAPRNLTQTQSAASLAEHASVRISTSCQAIDVLLEGGLKRGSVVEISGPPGTAKEAAAVNIAKSFLKAGRGVLFVGKSLILKPLTESSSDNRYAEYDQSVTTTRSSIL